MLTCMVVDDEQHAVDLLVHHISQTNCLQLIHQTTNPLEALEIFNTKKIDLVFLDIQMTKLSGLDFIKAVQGKCNVILCTAYAEYAFEGFEHNVIDYLLKPITFPRFIKAVQKAVSLLNGKNSNPGSEEKHLFIKTENKGKLLKIDFDEIDYVEGQKNYVAFHVGNQKKMALLNMKDVADLLPKSKFIRVHNSFIIPIAKVALIEGNTLGLKNITLRIPIGVTYKDEVTTALKIEK